MSDKSVIIVCLTVLACHLPTLLLAAWAIKRHKKTTVSKGPFKVEVET